MRPANVEVTARCPHCATAVAGPEDAYCCAGCEAAAALIRGAGLERYYDIRESPAPRPSNRADPWSTVEVEEGPDGFCETTLMVDGLRCASCVWVTESVLRRVPGVEDATVSYGTGRARLRWAAAETDLPALAGLIQKLGYRPRLGTGSAPVDSDLLVRLGIAAFAAANVMLLSAALYAGWIDPMEERFARLFQWWTLVLATPVAFWSAAPFFAGAWRGLRAGVLHMDVPIALGIGVLYGHGVVGVVAGFDTYLDSMTMLVALLLGGRVLESAGRRRSLEAALALAAVVPATARRRIGDTVEWVPSGDLAPGDVIDIGSGQEIPADGVVEEGEGRVRTALLTGESRPVAVSGGDDVWAGTVLIEGALAVRVSAAGGASLVHSMAESVAEAAGRTEVRDTADRLAPWFTAATLVAAGLTWVGWWSTGDTGGGLQATIAVLVVACPCALALARPLVGAAGLGAAARRGALFRSVDALLRAGEVDRVVLDKTGTVTEGEVRVTEATDEQLRVAAGLERFSAHPRAEAIVREAVRRGIPIPVGSSVEETTGVGISGRVDGARWAVRSGGDDAVELVGPGGPVGLVRFGDKMRDDAAETTRRLVDLGVEVTILSGDVEGPTREVAERVGAGSMWASQRPDAKAARVRAWREAGETVLFAGDGLNDGPALAAADVAVAMGSGAASSVLAADGVVLTDSLAPVEAAMRVGRVCTRVVRSSRVTSIVYNVVAVGAAAFGLVNPLVAAVLMPFSSALVLAQAARVERLVGEGHP